MRKIVFPSVLPMLKTKRLHLRELVDSDVPTYFALCSEEQTMRPYGIRAHKDFTETKRTIEFLRSELAAARGVRFGIFLAHDEKLVGDCGFWSFDHRRLRAEIGAKVVKAFARQGLMTEAFGALINFAFTQMNVHAIEANIAVDNVASHRLVEKAGFIKEGVRRQFSFCAYEERYKDSSLYSLLNNDSWSAHD